MAHYVDGLVVPFWKKARSRQRKSYERSRLAKMIDPTAMPFDVTRMMYGGFRPSLKRDALMDWVRRHDEY